MNMIQRLTSEYDVIKPVDYVFYSLGDAFPGIFEWNEHQHDYGYDIEWRRVQHEVV